MTFTQFRELELRPVLHDALDKMGFLQPTPIQAETIPAALSGKDILGCAQTGTGKTGAFGIPLIQYLLNNPERKALILAPTRELADQIHRNLSAMADGSEADLKIALIIGGASMQPQIDNLRRGARIIVATPGRLIDLIQQKQARLSPVGILVLDEVDRMLDMGFAPQLKQIVPHLPKERQTMLFSATLPKEIMAIAESYLKDPLRVSIGQQSAAAETVEQQMIQTEQPQKGELLIKELQERNGKIIVFVRTQHGTERLAKMVKKHGFEADRLHGGRTQGQRKRALENFRSGATQVLLATDIAGRGIDIDDIEFVINYDMPKTHEDYIHRIGRTGRNGRSGIAINFVTDDDAQLMRKINPEAYPRTSGRSSQGNSQHPAARQGQKGGSQKVPASRPQHNRKARAENHIPTRDDLAAAGISDDFPTPDNYRPSRSEGRNPRRGAPNEGRSRPEGRGQQEGRARNEARANNEGGAHREGHSQGEGRGRNENRPRNQGRPSGEGRAEAGQQPRRADRDSNDSARSQERHENRRRQPNERPQGEVLQVVKPRSDSESRPHHDSDESKSKKGKGILARIFNWD